MAKSIKLKNNTYWDSKSIVHNQNLLSDILYPVGSIYLSVNNINPATLFGGTWERISQGRFLIGVKEDNTYQENNIPDFGATTGMKGYLFNAEDKGGEYLNQLQFENYAHNVWSAVQGYENNNIAQMWSPSGNDFGLGLNYISNKNTKHNNMPPYFAVYMWKRTA